MGHGVRMNVVAGPQCGHGAATWALGPSSPNSIGQTVKYYMGLLLIRGSQHRGFRSKVMPSSDNSYFTFENQFWFCYWTWERRDAWQSDSKCPVIMN